jgi:hypothetical protein
MLSTFLMPRHRSGGKGSGAVLVLRPETTCKIQGMKLTSITPLVNLNLVRYFGE